MKVLPINIYSIHLNKKTSLFGNGWVFFFVLITGLAGGRIGTAQNLDRIKEQKLPVKITGGLSANQILYTASGIDTRRDPYSYFLSGNINFDLYGWSMPLSFSYSNQNVSFQQPFNQYGISPTYKWITSHIGYNSMNFSPYTLSGHIFSGVGVDLAPSDKWTVSAMYGRLNKGVEFDLLNHNNSPAYRRMGYGFKVGYGVGNDMVEVIMFKAKDELNSIAPIPSELEIHPEENLVMSINAAKTLFDKLVLKAEFAGSAITTNLRSETTERENWSMFRLASPLYRHRASSSYYSAFKSSLQYAVGIFTLGVNYERVAPGYRTLGAYFFNNDLENITLSGSTTLFKNKVNLSFNGGTQRNDLNNDKMSAMNRFVGSLNLSYAASQRLNFSGSYSSFQTHTNIRSQFVDINQLTPYDNLDTLNFTQISQSANINTSYVLSQDKDRRQHLNVNLSVQVASDKQAGISQGSGSEFYNLNASYSLNLVPQNLGLTLALNGNRSTMDISSSTTFGPTVGLNRSFFDKKLRSSVSTSLNHAYANSEMVNRVLNLRLSGSYALMQKHNLNLSMVALNRQSSTGQTSNFTEFTATLGYSYSF